MVQKLIYLTVRFNYILIIQEIDHNGLTIHVIYTYR